MTSTSDRSSRTLEAELAALHRAEWGRLLSLLVARTRRLDLAEDGLSEAFARAAESWPANGVPANPGGWLYTTAHRQILGKLRAEAVAGRKLPLLAVRPGWVVPDELVTIACTSSCSAATRRSRGNQGRRWRCAW